MRFNLLSKIAFKIAMCASLVWAADFLFYGECCTGWTQVLFGLLLLAGVLSTQRVSIHRNHTLIVTCALLGLSLAGMETPTALAGVLYGISILFLALLPRLTRLDDARGIMENVLGCAIIGWWRLYSDSHLLLRVRRRWHKTHTSKRALMRHWFLPIGLSFVFIILFAQANPIITGWLARIQWNALRDYLSIKRILFWLFFACGCWALLRPRFISRKPVSHSILPSREITVTALLFNEQSVLTSLILFNGLFMIQNILDMAFLWSSALLPEGMTHAQYAHQGAYPLIATALLAAAFVLVAFRPGSATERMSAIRLLVYAWVGQNVFLVLSSMARLLGYIEEYSLTCLRMAALIWMALVGLGLILIVARIYLRKANVWLVNANFIVLYVTLYLCCSVNFDGIIADYNIMHSREVTGNGANLDTYYLQTEIGTAAIPALLWFERNYPFHSRTHEVRALRKALQWQVNDAMRHWRQWTFRDFRLQQQLNASIAN